MSILKSEKVKGKKAHSQFFCYSYFTDSPLQKAVCAFLRKTSLLKNMGDWKGEDVF